MITTAQRYIGLVAMSRDRSKSDEIRDQADETIEHLESEASIIRRDGIRIIEFPDCSVLTIWDGDRDVHEDRAAADAYILDAIREANDLAGVQ